MSNEKILFSNSNNVKPKSINIFLVLIVLVFFGISLTQDAFVVESDINNKNNPSLIVFLFGSIALLVGAFFEWLIWLANPISLVSIILFLYYEKKLKRAIMFNVLALLLSCSFFFWKEVLISENGATSKIISLECGYYIWVFSILLLLIFQLFQYFNLKSIPENI